MVRSSPLIRWFAPGAEQINRGLDYPRSVGDQPSTTQVQPPQKVKDSLASRIIKVKGKKKIIQKLD